MKLTRAVTHRFVIPVLTILLLAACSSTPTTTPKPTTTLPRDTPKPSVPTQEPASLPLSEPGSYHAGIRRNLAFQDASRGGRKVAITIWYPAAMPQDSTSTRPTSDAVADPTGAPYPLILSSSKVAYTFGPLLASYGFVVVGVNGLDYYIPWDSNLVDQPLDILFALNQVAAHPIVGLEGMIDAQHAGAMGYSFDGYNALALSGARVDPDFYLTECAVTPLRRHWVQFGYCNLASAWDQFAAHAGEAITTSDDGLWQPMTDERIRAVMPMAPEGAALFGERGLSAVDRPTLIIGATDDIDCDYHDEAVYIFEHAGTPDKMLISFVGQNHSMVFDTDMVSRMAHFAVAFFGYQLQGREDFARYLSQEFIAQQEDLAWGEYEGE